MIITIPGKVKAKERPRKGRYGQFYTPPATRDFEDKVAKSALQSGLRRFDKTDTLNIGIDFYGKYGSSDIDNLIKSVLDGFKCYFNDNKVMEITARKIPSEEYSTEVRIEKIIF